MTTASRELFELCKKCYEATGWKQSPNISQLYEYWDDYDELCVISIEDADDTLVPAYTSDYLLEKLPVYSEDSEGMLSVTTRQGQERNGWMAYYEDVDGYSVSAEGIGKSPLEALLRLTLKVYEENVI